jgi:signal transduction histidine kinase
MPLPKPLNPLSYEEIYHDLKTPLAILYANLQLLEHMPDIPGRASFYVKEAKKNCFRMAKLVRDANDSALLNKGLMLPQFKNGDIVSAARDLTESARTLTEIKQIDLQFESAVPELLMAFDKPILERILLNLLSNARQYTEKGGRITVRLWKHGGCAHIAVRDYGPGLPADTDVFTKNSRTTGGGHSGLGLFIVRELATLHGGDVYMANVSPGTEAVVRLPVSLTEEETDELPMDDFFYENMIQMELAI